MTTEEAAIWLEPSTLNPWDRNPRKIDSDAVDRVAASIARFGFGAPLVAQAGSLRVIAGHVRLRAALQLKLEQVPVRVIDIDDAGASALALADNRLGELVPWDDDGLTGLLAELDTEGIPASLLGWDAQSLMETKHKVAVAAGAGKLSEQFLIVPFTVLDARRGVWLERKRAWIERAKLRSEAGREADLTYEKLRFHPRFSKAYTSIFDPVLVEIACRWFSPPDGLVIDPFSGGSVRGLVSTLCGRRYIGVDLRAEQVAENEAQLAALDPAPVPRTDILLDREALTPIDQVGEVFVKREDLFAIDPHGRINGSKVRALLALIEQEQPAGIVAASSRSSTMASRCALTAQALGLPCVIHTASGDDTDQTITAREAGAELVLHSPGYLSVCVSRAEKDAKARGWLYVPIGVEHPISVEQTRLQFRNVPTDGSVKRIVVPVGSGTALAGVLWGLQDAGLDVPVLGVCIREDKVRAAVTKKLDQWAPAGWRDRVNLIPCGHAFEDEVPGSIGDIELDPVYEAKCLPFLQSGDLLWVIGIRASSRPVAVPTGAAPPVPPRWIVGDSLAIRDLVGAETRADLILSCPPYGDLEVYSEDPHDLSAMKHEDFLVAYRAIIAETASLLAEDRFAVWVVGDFRDKKGALRNFVSDTIGAFEAAGMKLWNHAVVIQNAAALPIRLGKQFSATRKMGKTHQDFLVFLKGDADRAIEALGTVVIPEDAFALVEDDEADAAGIQDLDS